MCAPCDNVDPSRSSVNNYKFNAIYFYGAISISTLFFIGCVLIVFAFDLPHHESAQLMMLTVVGNFVTSSTLCLIVLFRKKCICKKETEDLCAVTVEPISTIRSNSSSGLERPPSPASRRISPPPSYHESEQFFFQNRVISSRSNNQTSAEDQDIRFSRYVSYVPNSGTTSPPTHPLDRIITYNIPASAIYSTPSNSSQNLIAQPLDHSNSDATSSPTRALDRIRTYNIPTSTIYSTPSNSSQNVTVQPLNPATSRTISAPMVQLINMTHLVAATTERNERETDVNDITGSHLPMTDSGAATEPETIPINDSSESQISPSTSYNSIDESYIGMDSSSTFEESCSTFINESCEVGRSYYNFMCSEADVTSWSHFDEVRTSNFIEYSGERTNCNSLNDVSDLSHDSINGVFTVERTSFHSGLLNTLDSDFSSHNPVQTVGIDTENKLQNCNRQSKHWTKYHHVTSSDSTNSTIQSNAYSKNIESTSSIERNDIDILDEALRQFDLCLKLQSLRNEKKPQKC